MRARFTGPLAETAAGAVAEAVVRACVHCGMCNATCPTFQLTGDELDGPRGRIYLMKAALEGEAVSRTSQLHLDRCLGCRACETTCPSGVEYHRLLDVGRPFVDARVPARPWRERALRGALRWAVPYPARFGFLLALGRLFAPLLPAELRAKLPPRPLRPSGPRPPRGEENAGPAAHSPPPLGDGARRRMSLLAGCVQSAAAPHFNAAATRVFARSGVDLAANPAAGCCGAVSFHLDGVEDARAFARRNIDAWLADLDAGAEAVVVTASGCAAFIRDYPDLFADDAVYAERARRVADRVRDPIEVLEAASPVAARAPEAPRIAVHEPCTQRHGLKLPGRVERLLRGLGYEPQPVRDPHLCCGSAGPYSFTQPDFAADLRQAKVAALTEHAPSAVMTANIGCWMHLAETSPVPVRHWLEAVDDVL
jgi:glycolate oxidase iron-sulfur subunit